MEVVVGSFRKGEVGAEGMEGPGVCLGSTLRIR